MVQPLNAAGLIQAEALATHIPLDIGRILSSPLLRARQTAERLGHVAGIPVEIAHSYIERDFGFCEGLTWPEANAGQPHLTFASALQSRDRAGDGVETIQAVVQRVASAMSVLLKDCEAERIRMLKPREKVYSVADKKYRHLGGRLDVQAFPGAFFERGKNDLIRPVSRAMRDAFAHSAYSGIAEHPLLS